MKTVIRRIRRLEDQLGPRDGKAALLITVCNGDWRFALGEERCEQILGECGYLPTYGVGVLSFRKVPDDLTAKELEILAGKGR